MPALLTNLALASIPGMRIQTEIIAFGGASLAAHWKRGEVQRRLIEQKWDAVVLQDQSTRPLRALKSMQQHICLYIKAVQASGAKAYLYMTWARKNLPESQEAIAIAYETLAAKSRAGIVPVGRLWEQARKLRSDLELYEADDNHPSMAGSYLSACAHLVSLFGVEPAESTDAASQLSATDKEFIHSLVRYPRWGDANNPLGTEAMLVAR